MAKVSNKYITLLQQSQFWFPKEFEQKYKLKVWSLGYTDSSTTLYTFGVRTKRTVRELQDMVWELNGGGWARVEAKDPMGDER
jgi:hypothetical protein